MTKVERMHEERINSLDRRVDVLSQKIDDFIAESRAARAETKEELKEMRADMKTLNQRIDDSISSFRNLTLAALFGIGGMTIAVIVAVALK